MRKHASLFGTRYADLGDVADQEEGMMTLVLVETRLLVADHVEELRILRAVATAAFPDKGFPRIILVARQEQQLAFQFIKQVCRNFLKMMPQESVELEDRPREFLESRINEKVSPLVPGKEVLGTENAEMELVEILQIEGFEVGKSALGNKFERFPQIERGALGLIIGSNGLNRRNSGSHDKILPSE